MRLEGIRRRNIGKIKRGERDLTLQIQASKKVGRKVSIRNTEKRLLKVGPALPL